MTDEAGPLRHVKVRTGIVSPCPRCGKTGDVVEAGNAGACAACGITWTIRTEVREAAIEDAIRSLALRAARGT